MTVASCTLTTQLPNIAPIYDEVGEEEYEDTVSKRAQSDWIEGDGMIITKWYSFSDKLGYHDYGDDDVYFDSGDEEAKPKGVTPLHSSSERFQKQRQRRNKNKREEPRRRP